MVKMEIIQYPIKTVFVYDIDGNLTESYEDG